MNKFHIITPTYNRANLLPRAIESVLKQKYDNWHLYIIDDGSTDNTKEVVQKYLEKYPDKITYKYKENGGVGSARNVGIKLALQNSKNPENDWVIFLDSDDELTEIAFENINLILQKYPGYLMYLTKTYNSKGKLYTYINKDVEEIDYKRWLNHFRDCGHFIKLNLFKNNNFRFLENINGGEGILWNKVYKHYNNKKIGIFINNYSFLIIYIETESLCRIRKRDKKWLKNALKIQEITLRNFGEDYKKYQSKKYGNILLAYAQYLALDGKKVESIRYFFKGIRYNTNFKLILLYIIALIDYKFRINNFILNKYNKIRGINKND